jgi:hypothetical protein
MTNANNIGGATAAAVRTGWVLTGLTAAFLALASALPKLIHHPAVAETMGPLGWPVDHAFGIGVLELAIAVLLVVPRTALLGAVLLTGLLGGAMATHLRVGSPLLSHTLFGLYLGLFAWGGLWLREPRLRALLPLRR